jgi:hypothetical protein
VWHTIQGCVHVHLPAPRPRLACAVAAAQTKTTHSNGIFMVVNDLFRDVVWAAVYLQAYIGCQVLKKCSTWRLGVLATELLLLKITLANN